jgi:hypothetical protein
VKKVFEVSLGVESPFTFSYLDRGFVLGNYVKPSLIIHNYSLTYGFNQLTVEKFLDIEGKPNYDFMRKVVSEGLPYLLPALPVSTTLRTRGIFYSTKDERIVEAKLEPQRNSPSQGLYVWVEPESRFKTYLVDKRGSLSDGDERILRLGKKREGVLRAKIRQVEFQVLDEEKEVFPFNRGDVENDYELVKVQDILVTRSFKFVKSKAVISKGLVKGKLVRVQAQGGEEWLAIPYSLLG